MKNGGEIWQSDANEDILLGIWNMMFRGYRHEGYQGNGGEHCTGQAKTVRRFYIGLYSRAFSSSSSSGSSSNSRSSGMKYT